MGSQTKKNILFELVANFPYSIGETYYEDEIKVIENYFDSIFLVITDYNKLIKEKPSFELSSKVMICHPTTNINLLEKIISFPLYFNPLIFSEFLNIKNFLKQNISMISLKTMLDSYLRARRVYIEMDKIISKIDFKKNDVWLRSYWCTEYILALIWLKKKYPVIGIYSKMHAWDIYFERNKDNYLPFRKYIYDNCDKFFVISNQGINYLKHKFPEYDFSKFQVSRLGVPNTFYKKSNKQKNKLVLFSVAFISFVKRLELIIEALALIENHEITWIHIGDGRHKDLSEVKHFAENKLKKKTNIHFIFEGKLSKKQVINYLSNNNLDVLINTSQTEGLPVSMMEASSFGYPIIGTNVGGVSEILHDNKNGFLMNKNPTAKEIAYNIEKFAAMTEEDFENFRKSSFNNWKKDFDAEINYTHQLKLMNVIQ
jgi:colanic acid/amylovoran biosynthesis glycosyltransferase